MPEELSDQNPSPRPSVEQSIEAAQRARASEQVAAGRAQGAADDSEQRRQESVYAGRGGDFSVSDRDAIREAGIRSAREAIERAAPLPGEETNGRQPSEPDKTIGYYQRQAEGVQDTE